MRYGLLDSGVALVEAQRQIACDLRRGLRGLILVAPNLTGKWCTTRCGERYRAAGRRERR